MDIKENILKDLKYIEKTKENLQKQYDDYFEQYSEDYGVDEEEFNLDLAVAHDIMNMLAMDKQLPSALYIEDLRIRLNMIENALNTLVITIKNQVNTTQTKPLKPAFHQSDKWKAE